MSQFPSNTELRGAIRGESGTIPDIQPRDETEVSWVFQLPVTPAGALGRRTHARKMTATRARSLTAAPRDERSADERTLLVRYARTRDPKILDELVKTFMPLARRLAARYRGDWEPVEDL